MMVVLFERAWAAQDGTGIEGIGAGLGLLLLSVALAPTLIAGFAPGRPFQALLVFFLNLAAVAGLLLFVLPGVLLWLFDLIVALMVYNGAKRDKLERMLIKQQKNILQQTRSLAPSDEKICPRCAETVKAGAKVCRYCNYEFEQPVKPITEPE